MRFLFFCARWLKCGCGFFRTALSGFGGVAFIYAQDVVDGFVEIFVGGNHDAASAVVGHARVEKFADFFERVFDVEQWAFIVFAYAFENFVGAAEKHDCDSLRLDKLGHSVATDKSASAGNHAV